MATTTTEEITTTTALGSGGDGGWDEEEESSDYKLLHFKHPLMINSLMLPGAGASGSETPTLGGNVVVLRSITKLGRATIGFHWERWEAIQYVLDTASAGTILEDIEFEGYSGNAILPAGGGITWKAVAGDDAPQEYIVETDLDLYDGEVTLILLGT